tara:strand:+ start:624 stop:875 length:252 start_codon:yes stop_codon:yes gene_type:complete
LTHLERLTQLISGPKTGHLLGRSSAGAYAGDLIGATALAIEIDVDIEDRTLCELRMMFAEVMERTATDRPPSKKNRVIRYGLR